MSLLNPYRVAAKRPLVKRLARVRARVRGFARRVAVPVSAAIMVYAIVGLGIFLAVRDIREQYGQLSEKQRQLDVDRAALDARIKAGPQPCPVCKELPTCTDEAINLGTTGGYTWQCHHPSHRSEFVQMKNSSEAYLYCRCESGDGGS